MDFEEQCTVPGSIPECGAIFMSNNKTKRECLRKKVFGLPSSQAYFVQHIKDGMLLFLFEFERRELHGVFQACSDGAMNIVPHAFSSMRKQFPAQVIFSPLWNCNPLSEREFREAIRENYYSPKKFKFGLSLPQVQRLLHLFSKKKLEDQGPPRQLSEGRFPRGREHAVHRFRRVASSDRSFRNDQVTGGHKTHNNFDQTFPTMFPEDHYRNYETSIGTSNRKEQSVGVGNIDERDCCRSLATNLNFGYEHQADSPFAPTFSDACFEDPLADFGVDVAARRSVAASGRAGKQWNVETPVKQSFSAEYPSENFRRSPEEFRTKRNDWFGGEDYKENAPVLPHSSASPSFCSWKLNPTPVSSKYSLEDKPFKHDPAVLSSTFLHAAKPLSSMLSQQTLYRDAVVTTTLPYDSDVPYLHNHNSPSVGIMQRLDSFPMSDNNQFVPSYSSSCMFTDGGIRSSNCIPELYDRRHDSKTSLPESASYKIRATELMDEGYEGFSYMEPSLPCTFSEPIHDMIESEKLPPYSAQHKVLGPSVTSGRYSAASLDAFDQNLPARGRNVEFDADRIMLKKYEGNFIHYCHTSNSLDPAVSEDSESPYSGHQQGSVFSRLSLNPKARKEKKYHLYNNADKLDRSVDEVMAMLHHNNQHWGKARCKLVEKASNPTESFKRRQEAVFKSKETTDLSESTSMKMEREGNSEIDDNKSENAEGVPFVDFRRRNIAGKNLCGSKSGGCRRIAEEDNPSVGHDNKSDNAEGVPFVDFKRRNIARKNLCDSKSGGSSRIAQEDDPSAGQQKRRKLVRPDFSKNETCDNWDTCNSFKIEEVSQVYGSPSRILTSILTRAMEDSMRDDNENKVSPIAGSPHVTHETCTVDEIFGSQRKQVENSQASLGRCAEGKIASPEQHKRRRLVRPNFDKSKEPQEWETGLSAKIEPTPMAKCSVSEDNISSVMVSVDCVKRDTSQDGKFSQLLCPTVPKDASVDSQKQTVVSPGTCIVIADGERNMLSENGCAQCLPSFSFSCNGNKSKEFLNMGEQRSVASSGCDKTAGHLITLRTGDEVSNANSEGRHVDEDSKRAFFHDSPCCESSHERH